MEADCKRGDAERRGCSLLCSSTHPKPCHHDAVPVGKPTMWPHRQQLPASEHCLLNPFSSPPPRAGLYPRGQAASSGGGQAAEQGAPCSRPRHLPETRLSPSPNFTSSPSLYLS